MATTILDCEVVATHDAWGNVGGANKVESVRRPDDDATSMISISTLNAKQSYFLDAAPAGTTGAISNVDTFRRTRESGANSAIASRTFLILGASTVNGTPDSPVATTWLDTTETAWARPGGGAWTTADFPGGSAGTELGIEETTDSANSIQCTTLYLTITYTLAASDFAIFIAQLAAMAGPAVMARELVAFFRGLKMGTLDREEIARGMAMLRRQPRYA